MSIFNSKKVWVIIDDVVGNANQTIAVAKALGYDFKVKKLKYSFWSFLPNWLKFNLWGISIEKSDSLFEEVPDIIISGGRKTAAVSAYLKKRHPNIFNVHLMNPDMNFSNFNLVCLPEHDRKPNLDHKNIIYTIGAPCYLDEKLIRDKIVDFKNKLSTLSKPYICLLIGGKTKFGDYSIEELEDLVKQVVKLVESLNGSLLITTSRRTHTKFLAESLNDCKIPYFFFDWHVQDITHNPYLAFLKISEFFVLTGDSVSICSEVLSTGKPTYVYRKNNLLSTKHQKFLDYLNKNDYIRFLDNDTNKLEHWDYIPLNEATKISSIIKDKL